MFKDKPGGLIVDYLGLADQLKRVLATYTESGSLGNPTYDTKQAITGSRGSCLANVDHGLGHPVSGWAIVEHGWTIVEHGWTILERG